MFLTRSPLNLPEQAPWIPFDLHVLSPPPAFVLSQDQTLHQELPTCVGCVLKESSCGRRGKTLEPQFLTFICFCWGCMGMHPRIDLDDIHGKTMLSPALLFSLLFCFQGANALGMYPVGSDTDTQLCVKRLEGASCNANGVQPNSNMGFREI